MRMRHRAAAALVAMIAMAGSAGCAAEPAEAPSASSASAPAPGFVIDADFPDPDVVGTVDGYLAFATGTYGVNIQMARGADLHEWTVTGDDALPVLPPWASAGRTWAPDVSEIDGRAVMYFTAEHTDSGRQCIGVATSQDLDGVYAPAGREPLVCPVDAGGAIDPGTFVDSDGQRYLLWKTDGNCCGLDTWIEIAPLASDGLSLTGEPTRLIRQTLPWEGSLVEAPTLVKHGDEYVLFYSANDYGGDDYAMGAARAGALLGPYTKQDDPVLTTAMTDGMRRGPGGQDIVPTDEGDMIVFHSWDDQYIYRGMNIAPLDWGTDRVGVDLG